MKHSTISHPESWIDENVYHFKNPLFVIGEMLEALPIMPEKWLIRARARLTFHENGAKVQ